MNGRLQLIEQKLLAIDSAAFQNLCDVYLKLKEEEFSSINRTGSQLGKQKTIKGTPDTFFRLNDGSLRYVEYTTKSDNLVTKIKGDIDKCLDSSQTGVQSSEVNKIIICFNSRLKVSEETDIFSYAKEKRIRLELIGLDWLALEIYSKYLILAKDILGIPLDTGQLLPISNFIEEYNNKAGKLSTPLNNVFIHREEELKDIETLLISNDILIISGAPGVGKTKIGLETLQKYVSKNADYSTFVIAKKDQDISEDLKINLQQNKNYILLIDDANRQLVNYKQLLGIFKESRNGVIKIILTVRDYALNEIVKECIELDPPIITIKKFTDKEITDLISSESIGVANPKYHTRIIELADGNARLAVMASRLAHLKKEEFLIGDVSDLYDTYFQTFVKDFDIFNDTDLIKTLGIISFFYTIDISNKDFINNILEKFEIDYYKFFDSVNELEKRELVETKQNQVRVSEQIISTYFFYKVFIKDEKLSFEILLFNFFDSWRSRFPDTIISSNNTFGYPNVFDKINSTLNKYLNHIYSDEAKVLNFFSVFWFYKREELLSYFHKRIQQIPEPESPIYNPNYETNSFVWNKNQTLDFISNLFRHPLESFTPALELAFEYVRKKPESFPELIKIIRETLPFDDDDSRNNFTRQTLLFDLLIEKNKEKQLHFISAFFTLSKSFLMHYYDITRGGRGRSIVFYSYPLPFYEITKQFRYKIWITLFELFETYPYEVLDVIKNYKPSHHGTIQEITDFDLSCLIPFIDTKLNPSLFIHIHVVRDLIVWLEREKVSDRTSYKILEPKFNSSEYELFLKLDWSALRGKQSYEFDSHEEFKKLKEEDLKKSFVFKTINDFEAINRTIKYIFSIDKYDSWGIEQSLDIIIEENFIQNTEIGVQLLKNILNNYPKGINPLYSSAKLIIDSSEDRAVDLWKFIDSWDNECKIVWKLMLLNSLPENMASSFFKKELFKTFKSINTPLHISIERLTKFDNIRYVTIKDNFLHFLSTIPIIKKFISYREISIIEKILIIICEKIEKERIKIVLPFDFFVNYSELLSNNFELLSKAYLQQEEIHDHFDYQREGLKKIINIDHTFLIKYISKFYNDRSSHRGYSMHNSIPFVWDLKNCNTLIEDSANVIVKNITYFGILEHPISIFFRNLNEEQLEKAKSFITYYITKYSHEDRNINAIFDMIRHVMNDFFEEAFMYYLTLNTDVDLFKKIHWRGNGGSYSGDIIIGEIEAKDWQKILEMIERSKNQLELIPIKAYVRKEIEYALLHAEAERKRKFSDPNK